MLIWLDSVKKYHYFFIYDSRDIISDKNQFIQTYSHLDGEVNGKRIRVFILQKI